MHGFQLWINLPAREKMTEPGYRDISAEAIPSTTTAEGVTIRIIAGSVAGIGGAVRREATEPLYLDLEMPAGSAYEAPIPGGHNAFLYVYEGEVGVGTRGEPVRARQLAVLTNRADADGVRLTASRGARSLLVAGRPLNEPIVQWGPFVMNTRDEVEQAMHDFRSGKF